MAEHLEAMTVRNDRNGKARWTKIGALFPARDGSMVAVLDALPLPTLNQNGELETRILFRKPLPKRDDGGAAHEPARGGSRSRFDDDGDVPF